MSAGFKLKQAFFRKYRDAAIKEHKLNYLFWECTLRCNLNCRHCGSDCLKSSSVKDMPAADFISVLDDIKENLKPEQLMICITGGEPLLRDDLEAVGKEIYRRGFGWGIVTNALAMTPQRFSSLLSAGLGSISFSIDGLYDEHTYLRRNKDSFKKVCEAIDMAVAVNNQYPSRLVYDVITCVHKGNLDKLSELRDFLIEKGVKNWRIFSIFPEGRAAENDLALDNSQYKKLMDFIKESRSWKNQAGKSISVNYACEGYLGPYELKVRDYFFFCRGGINVGSVMCDGSISACLSVRGKDFIQGNIYNEKFSDVWKNKYLNMRDRSWARHGKCEKCKEWKNCLGNGLHLHHDMQCEVAHCNFELLQ